MRNNSCRNWSTLSGMAHSAILKELEICDFYKTRQAFQTQNEMMTTAGKNFKNF